MATSETDELRNGREGGRGAAIRQERNGRGNNRKFNARNGFNPDHRRGERHGCRRGFNLTMGNANYRTIIIVFGNDAPMQPRMKRRAKLRRRHEQPQRQRQNRRRDEEPFASASFDWIYQLQTICFYQNPCRMQAIKSRLCRMRLCAGPAGRQIFCMVRERVGSRMVMTRGVKCVRPVFLTMVVLITLKMIYDNYFKRDG